jgi:hypothetical protein
MGKTTARTGVRTGNGSVAEPIGPLPMCAVARGHGIITAIAGQAPARVHPICQDPPVTMAARMQCVTYGGGKC